MGRHKKHANWKGKKQPSANPNPNNGYETAHFITENKAFEAYYKFALQQEFANEEEWNDFMKILKVKLPVVFRINDNVPNSKNFLDKLKTPSYISKLLTAEPTKPQPETLEKPSEIEPSKEVEEKKILDQLSLNNIPWYPNEQVWQLNTPRYELKKNKAYQNLHKFITRATEAGLISRQELVSMLPPLLLDVKSTDIILDMCAAPGSKTAQLLELLYKDENLGKGPTQGCVIANDIDYRRAAMLIHQLQRISTTGMMVVSHSGQHFPTLKPADGEGDKFLFDKVLADVPCSGDGAIRKLPAKWGKWSVRDGLGLHSLQVQIAIRAVQLTKVGGYVLYSTCSINPVEDEAVVVELFRRCKNDALEIVDISEKLPGLITRPGMLNWSICDEKEKEKAPEEGQENIPASTGKTAQELFHIYKSFSELPETYQGNIKESMFPESLEKMRDEIKIQNTIRVMPHDQNTGGFYLALLRKKDHAIFSSKSAKNQKEEETENLEEKDKAAVLEAEGKSTEEEPEAPKEVVEEEKKIDAVEKPEVKKKVRRGDPPLKKPVFEKFNPEEWDWIKEYYGITDESVKDLFIQQNEGDRKVLMVSPGVKKILDLDTAKGGLNKLHMGAKVMHKNRDVFLENKHPWRVTQDALSSMLHFMKKEPVKCSAKDFIYMIQKMNMTLADLPSDDLRQKIANTGRGCFILECENDGPVKEKESLSCLSLPNSVVVMVSIELVESLKLRYMDTVSEQ